MEEQENIDLPEITLLELEFSRTLNPANIRWCAPGKMKKYKLPDGLRKLNYLANACIGFIEDLRRGNLKSCMIENSLGEAVSHFYTDLRLLALAVNEGRRLLPKFQRELASIAGGVVSACGEYGVNAHELVFQLANAVGSKITGVSDLQVDELHGWIIDVNGETMRQALSGITVDSFEKQYARMQRKLKYVDFQEIERLKVLIHREYLVASQTNSHPSADCDETSQSEKADKQDNKTDKNKKNTRKIEKPLPRSDHVSGLCRRLQKEVPKGRTKIEIAREFTFDEFGNDSKAAGLLRQARRYKYLWEQ